MRELRTACLSKSCTPLHTELLNTSNQFIFFMLPILLSKVTKCGFALLVAYLPLNKLLHPSVAGLVSVCFISSFLSKFEKSTARSCFVARVRCLLRAVQARSNIPHLMNYALPRARVLSGSCLTAD